MQHWVMWQQNLLCNPIKQLFLVLVEKPVTNRDGGMIKAKITKETNLFIKPQNVEDNERRCSSCKSRKFASKYQ